ncbi:MAG: hypothetical protein R2731_00645 [Nocardioides sp.]
MSRETQTGTRRPRSLGFATDEALLVLQGGVVEAHRAYLVERMPANPTYHWGNCLILDGAPERGSLAAWVATFRAEHPGAAHVAIGIDDPAAELDPAEAGALGLAIERDIVLTATELTPSAHPEPDGVRCEPFHVDDDAAWTESVELDLADHLAESPDDDAVGHRAFLQARHEGLRRLQRAGHGAWFGARTSEGRLVATLGVYRAGLGLARYQSVLTDRAHRRRGSPAPCCGTPERGLGATSQRRPW